MPLLAKRLVALAAAYGLVAAVFLGSIAAGQGAASAAPVCRSLVSGTQNPAPGAPKSRDLACLVSGCCGCAFPDFAPAPAAVVARAAVTFISWRNPVAGQFRPGFFSSPSARAPPAAV
jgi:hypothetical protein